MIKDITVYSGIKKLSESNTKKDGMSKQDIKKVKEFIKDCKLNTENLYIDSTFTGNYVYYFDGVFLSEPIQVKVLNKNEYASPKVKFTKDENGKISLFGDADEEPVTIYQRYKDDFLAIYNKYMEMYNKGKMYFRHSKEFYPLVYSIFYEKMNKKQRFYSFMEMFKFYEGTQRAFTFEEIKEIILNVPEELVEKRKRYRIFDKDGFVKIYRAEQASDGYEEEEISWTRNLKIARFFLERNRQGKILCGKVHRDDIVFIYEKESYSGNSEEEHSGDEEKEILVKPGSVKDVKEIE